LTVFAVGQAKIPTKKICAEEFVACDADGKERVTLNAFGLYVRSASDGYGCSLTFAGLQVSATDSGSTSVGAPGSILGGGICLYDKDRDKRMALDIDDRGPSLTLLRKPDPVWRAYMKKLSDGSASMGEIPKEVQKALNKSKGLILGATGLVKGDTGVTETRPESSIVLFNTDGFVSWEVP
jgi:hypothetical protein